MKIFGTKKFSILTENLNSHKRDGLFELGVANKHILKVHMRCLGVENLGSNFWLCLMEPMLIPKWFLVTHRFSPGLGSSWPFLNLYSVSPQHLLKESGGPLAVFCVVERVSWVRSFCSSRRLGSGRRMSWWWDLCQRKLSGQECAHGPAARGQGKTPSGTTLRNGVRSLTPCIKHRVFLKTTSRYLKNFSQTPLCPQRVQLQYSSPCCLWIKS